MFLSMLMITLSSVVSVNALFVENCKIASQRKTDLIQNTLKKLYFP
jgi:hypothetical protein